MKNKNEILRLAPIVLFVLSVMWISITTLTQRFKCSKMTETELFLHIPKSFIMDFKNC